MVDAENLHHALIGQIIVICRDDNAHRESELQAFIETIADVHVTAICALAGAALMTAKLRKSRGQDYSEIMDVVRNLVESMDAKFSLELRNNVLNFVANQETPDPFERKGT